MSGERASLPPLVAAEDSPVWTRAYSAGPEPACAELAQVLAALRARRMVVGHTPQASGVNEACGGALWRIDVGLARHYGGPLEALQIAQGRASVLRAGN
jgi:hypothetical protein